jgi:hypothetical protein
MTNHAKQGIGIIEVRMTTLRATTEPMKAVMFMSVWKINGGHCLAYCGLQQWSNNSVLFLCHPPMVSDLFHTSHHALASRAKSPVDKTGNPAS